MLSSFITLHIRSFPFWPFLLPPLALLVLIYANKQREAEKLRKTETLKRQRIYCNINFVSSERNAVYVYLFMDVGLRDYSLLNWDELEISPTSNVHCPIWLDHPRCRAWGIASILSIRWMGHVENVILIRIASDETRVWEIACLLTRHGWRWCCSGKFDKICLVGRLWVIFIFHYCYYKRLLNMQMKSMPE